MIGFLRGVLLKKQPPLLILDVDGVGYEIEAPMTTFYILPDVGNKIEQIIQHTKDMGVDFSKIPTFKPFSYADIAASIPLAPQPRTIMSKSKLVFSTII